MVLAGHDQVTEQEDEIVVDGDEVVNITPEETTRGGLRYVDPVLADVAKQLQEARIQEAIIKRRIRALTKRQDRRINLLRSKGPLADWPTATQRQFITGFEMAMQLGQIKMLELTYKLCIEGDVHMTKYLFAGEEPIMSAYARRATELEEQSGKA